MKRIVTLTILFCSIASSVLAANPEDALKALNLGNQKYVLEQSMEGGPLAAVIVDPTVSASPAALFGLAGTQLIAAKTDGTGLEQALGAPLILILGTEENAVWAVYAEVLKSSADLIHAVLKGKTVIQGAVLTPSTGEVKILGSHPDLVIMAAQHVLGTPAQPAPADATPAPQQWKTPLPGNPLQPKPRPIPHRKRHKVKAMRRRSKPTRTLPRQKSTKRLPLAEGLSVSSFSSWPSSPPWFSWIKPC